MINNETQNKVIKEKLDFFYAEKVAVHIAKHNREFLNGNLLEKKSDEIFVIEDRIKGRLTLFISEIFDVSELREEGK